MPVQFGGYRNYCLETECVIVCGTFRFSFFLLHRTQEEEISQLLNSKFWCLDRNEGRVTSIKPILIPNSCREMNLRNNWWSNRSVEKEAKTTTPKQRVGERNKKLSNRSKKKYRNNRKQCRWNRRIISTKLAADIGWRCRTQLFSSTVIILSWDRSRKTLKPV